MKKLEDMKEFEFSELLSKTKFRSIKEEKEFRENSGLDEDGDEIREEFIENKNEKKHKENKLHKYISFATGFAYTILAPVILLLGIYFILERIFRFQRNELVIIFLVLLGLVTGYWTLFKDINKLTGKGMKNDSKDKKIK